MLNNLLGQVILSKLANKAGDKLAEMTLPQLSEYLEKLEEPLFESLEHLIEDLKAKVKATSTKTDDLALKELREQILHVGQKLMDISYTIE